MADDNVEYKSTNEKAFFSLGFANKKKLFDYMKSFHFGHIEQGPRGPENWGILPLAPNRQV